MKLVASVSLNAARHPRTVLHLPQRGELLLHEVGQWGSYLEAYDPDLVSVWSAHFAEETLKLFMDGNGMPWMLDRLGAFTLGERGELLGRVAAQVPEGMLVSACACVDDDFLFAMHHARRRMRAPIMQRVSKTGNVRWSVTLPGPSTDEKMNRVGARAWLSTSETLDISGDAALACFSDMHSSGMGFGYVLSIADGALRFTTAYGPVQSTAPLGGGAFLVGYQGYGLFETLRYERDGRVRMRWPSHGHYIVSGEDIRGIELQNVLPSKMHLTRLLNDGSVLKGARLDGYYTSTPSHWPDGTVLFFRHGSLLGARDLAIEDRLELCAPDDGTISTAIAASGETAYLALWEWRPESRTRSLMRVDR
jgi:hypothetical protein